MISAAQLAAMQAAATRTLDLSGTIQRNPTPLATDAWGHVPETWPTIQTLTPINQGGTGGIGLTEPTAREMQTYATLIGSSRAWKVSFPYGTDIKRNDRITVGGQIMRVQVDETLGSYSTLTQVLATEVNETIH